MRVRARTALGVEVSPAQVCMALVRRDRHGPVLVRAARATLPAGTIRDGRIEDPSALIKVLVDLRSRCKGHPEQTAVSLFGAASRLQILELPNPLPANVGAFVQNEIKQCVTLGAGQIVSDFCSLESTGPRRLLVATADGAMTLSLAEACEQAKLGIDAVEPSLLAAIRGLSAKRIAATSDRTVLLAVLSEHALELCVFKGCRLEFLRVRDLAGAGSDPDALSQQLAKEIQAVVHFYEVEAAETPTPWQITVLQGNGVRLPEAAAGRLKPRGSRAEVEILTGDRVGPALGIECSDSGILAEASPAAVGLALRLLTMEDGSLHVNLMPPEIRQKRTVRRNVLIAAVCAASLLVGMVLCVMGLRFKIENHNEYLVGQKAKESFAETVALISQQREVEERIEKLSKGQGRIGEVLKVQRQVDWPALMEAVRDGMPAGLRITRLTSGSAESPEMLIEGWSVNYRTIALFAKKLNQSPSVLSATVVKSDQADLEGRMYFVYQIRCALDSKVGI